MLARLPGLDAAVHLLASALLEWRIVGTAVHGSRFPLLTHVPEAVCRAWLRRPVPELRRTERMAREPLRAYEGVSLPELPNAFTTFGPYSWTGVGSPAAASLSTTACSLSRCACSC